MVSKVSRIPRALAAASSSPEPALPAITMNVKAMPTGLNKGLQKAWKEYQTFNFQLEAALKGKTHFTLRNFLRDQWRYLTGDEYPNRNLTVTDIATALRYLIMERGYRSEGQATTVIFKQNYAAAMAVVKGTPVEKAGFSPVSQELRKYESESPEGVTVINLYSQEDGMVQKVKSSKSVAVANQPKDEVVAASGVSATLNAAADMIVTRKATDEEIMAAVSGVTMKNIGRLRRKLNRGLRAGYLKPETPYTRLVRGADGKLVAKAEAKEPAEAKVSGEKSKAIINKLTGMNLPSGKVKKPAPSVQRPSDDPYALRSSVKKTVVKKTVVKNPVEKKQAGKSK